MINFERILDIFIFDIIPETYKNVSKGNKIFGAAILNKKDLSIVNIGLNNEILNPLFHGEISTINAFYEKGDILDIKDCIFISTHEPCSLCLSAITWAGFNNFFYFFPFSDTKNKFNIPHDLKILSEVFKIKDGGYNKNNSYWQSFSIINEISKLENIERKLLKAKIDKIYKEYEILSIKYQQNKDQNQIPLN